MTHSISDLRSCERLENLRVGFDGRLERRGGTRNLCTLAGKLRGALSVSVGDEDFIYVVAANRLYKLKLADDMSYTSTSLGSLSGASFADADEKVELFMFAGRVCILAGGEYFVSDGTTVSKVAGYVPLIRKNTDRLGVGEDYERMNLLTDQVRMTFIADGSIRDFRLNFKVTSVDAVYVSGNLVDPSEYSVVKGSYYTTVSTTSVYTAMGDKKDIVEIHFTLDKVSERSRVTSCRHAAVYGGDTDSRVFLYGGSEQASIFPSEPSGADSQAGQTIALDYFPVGGHMVVGDGNLPVCGACRQFDRLAIFTSESAYYTYPHEDGTVNGLKRFSFPILPLNSDVGATKTGGAVLVENEPYSLSADSLYRFKSTSVRDERLAIRVEPPSCFSFSGNTESMRLYANKLRGELWCYTPERIVIYNARYDCWYSFTGVSADFIFSFRGEAAFISNRTVRVFSDLVYTDVGSAFVASCETGWLEMGKGSARGSSLRLGAVVGSSSARRALKLTLLTDCGVYPSQDSSETAHAIRSTARYFKAPPSDSPTVFSSRARIRRISHAKLRLETVERVEETGEDGTVTVSDSGVGVPIVLESIFIEGGE